MIKVGVPSSLEQQQQQQQQQQHQQQQQSAQDVKRADK